MVIMALTEIQTPSLLIPSPVLFEPLSHSASYAPWQCLDTAEVFTTTACWKVGIKACRTGMGSAGLAAAESLTQGRLPRIPVRD